MKKEDEERVVLFWKSKVIKKIFWKPKRQNDFDKQQKVIWIVTNIVRRTGLFAFENIEEEKSD